MKDSKEVTVGSRERLAAVLAVLSYALFAAWLTWPALAELGAMIPGDEGDAFVHLWTYDWVKDALQSGKNVYFTQRLFFPEGVELYTHNIAWLNIALWLPLQALVGESAAYTLVYLLVLVLNGAATFLLVRHLTAHLPAAFVAGFIVTGWPRIIASYSHPNLIFIAFVPLSLLAMHRLVTDGRWTGVLWLGLLVAGIGYSRYQMLILSAPLLGLAALYWLWQETSGRAARSAGQLLAAVGLAILLLLPLAGPVVGYQLARDHGDDLVVLRNEWEEDETDLLGYILPGEGAPFAGPLLAQRFPNLLTHTPIGLVTLMLAAAGLFVPRRDRWLWLGMAVLLLLLALGRSLVVNGQASIPLPYAWLEDNLLIMQLVRYPSRFAVLLSIPMAVLAGYGVLLITSRLTFGATAAVTAGLALLIALSYRVPDYPLLDLDTPAWYAALGQEAGTFGLVTIPLTRIFDEYAMNYQLTHNKPLVAGHVSRPPREAHAFIEASPFLSGLRERTLEPPDAEDVTAQLRPLAENNLPYLVIHKAFLSLAQLDMWRSWMGIAPHHEDDELLVYSTALIPGEDFRLQPSDVAGLAFVGGRIAAPAVARGDNVRGTTHWSLDAPAAHEWVGCYEITDAQSALVDEICTTISFPPAASAADQLVRDAFSFPVGQELESGTYQLSVQLSDGAGRESGRFLLGPLYLSSETGRRFAAPDPETVLEVDLGSSLSLLGFDGPRVGNQSVDLTLFWRAEEEMDRYYKFFVHLVDPRNQALAAQLDTVPHNWAYPTNLWLAGEVVADRLSLPLTGVAPGTYELRIGVYDPDTGQRLPPTGAAGQTGENNSISLGPVVVEDSS